MDSLKTILNSKGETGDILALRKLWNAGIKVKASIAMWRLPFGNTIHFLVDFSKKPKQERINLQTIKPGFVVSPFLSPEGNESIHLNADLHITFGAGTGKIEGSPNVPTSFLSIINEQINLFSIPFHLNIRPDTEISGEKNHFISMVKDGLIGINRGDFSKVVIARTLDSPLENNFDIVDQFCRLEKDHPEAFINLVSIPGRGTWIGVSPELLVETLGKRKFRTVSLAGTQPFQELGDLKKATWNQKEIEEQAMVSRYIIEQFKTIRLREFTESGPRTVRAGSMIHLKTEYMVDMEKTHFPELGTVMLHLLHPTSAVCGMPKFPALQFILANEHLNREFYSGFLGPVNIKGNSQLYVNLRCMQIMRSRVILYAGAGITHDSDPEKEWEETELKCQTLLNAMNLNEEKSEHSRTNKCLKPHGF